MAAVTTTTPGAFPAPGSANPDDTLPPHGTYARANGRFYAGIKPYPCTPCRDAEFRYDKQRRIDKEAGRERTMPADQTRADVELLAAAGMTYLDIAAAARCTKSTIQNLRRPGARVTARTAARIAGVRAAHSAMKTMPSLGAVRRIQAALGAGHPQSVFAAEAGLGVQYVSEMVNGRVPTIRADTHARIDAAYRTLIANPAPAGKGASRARNRARAAGWPTPEQWEDRIDDPDADPTAWVRTGKPRCAEELVEDAEFIARTTGVIDVKLIAERIGVRRNTLQKARERASARRRRCESAEQGAAA